MVNAAQAKDCILAYDGVAIETIPVLAEQDDRPFAVARAPIDDPIKRGAIRGAEDPSGGRLEGQGIDDSNGSFASSLGMDRLQLDGPVSIDSGALRVIVRPAEDGIKIEVLHDGAEIHEVTFDGDGEPA